MFLCVAGGTGGETQLHGACLCFLEVRSLKLRKCRGSRFDEEFPPTGHLSVWRGSGESDPMTVVWASGFIKFGGFSFRLKSWFKPASGGKASAIRK